MDPESQLKLQAHFANLSDVDLQRTTCVERSQLRPEALQLALEELSRRRVPVLTPAEYWRQSPEEWLAYVGFCHPCWAATTDEMLGPASSGWRLVGVGLTSFGDPCKVCGSVTATKAFFVVVPVAQLGRYRVLLDQRRYGDPPKGRRLRDDAKQAVDGLTPEP
jgi:hypothetical protein